MKDFINGFVFKLKTAWNAYKTAGDILAAEKAFEDECKYELEQRAYMDRMDSCSTLHPPYQDAVISKPRVVQRKPRVTMAKRRKNAKKRTAK